MEQHTTELSAAETPKGVVLVFSRALSAGDVVAAKALSTGDARTQTLEALAELASATARLQKSLKARFGGEATRLEIFTESPDAEDELRRSTETITGDSAVIRLSPTDRNPSRLKKVEGQWKFDVTKYKASEPTVPQLRKIAAAWAQLASEVGAGRFATLDNFKQEYAARTTAAAGG